MMLMDGHRIKDLQTMYSLFLRVNALESLRQALSMYIRRTGQGIVMDEEKDKDMVSSLLEFKASLDSIWEESFSKNEGFCITIKDAFEHLINLRQVSLLLCWSDLNWLQNFIVFNKLITCVLHEITTKCLH
jgi:cullin-4